MLRLDCFKSNKGNTLVIVILFLFTILASVLPLLTDIAHWLIIKHELEACTDAAALAGASCFRLSYPVDGSGVPAINDASTIVTIDPIAAQATADKVFNDNISIKNLNGVTVVSKQGKVTTSKWSNPEYSYTATVTVSPLFLRMQRIIAISRADVNR